MTTQNEKIELSYKDKLACNLMGELAVNKKDPTDPRVLKCFKNRVIMKLANALTGGRAVEVAYKVLTEIHVDGIPEYELMEIDAFCESLLDNI